MDGTILIADDDRTLRTVLTHALTRAGCKVHATASLETLTGWVSEGRGDLVITDVMMPDGNGLDNLQRIFTLRPQLPVIVISAQNTIVTAVRAEEAQAFHYLPKPFDLPELMQVVKQGLATRTPRGSAPVGGSASEDSPNREIIGRSQVMQDLYRAIARMKDSPLPVLILGESGTGKTQIAQAMHAFSPQSDQALTVTGAFDFATMDAAQRAFERAEGDAILIETVSDFDAVAQQNLLSLLNRHPGKKIYATGDASFIAAVQEGTFRADVFHRINGLAVHLPPLRERREDIPLLVEFMLNQSKGAHAPSVSDEALTMLNAYHWPGNVRELKHVTERMVLMAAGLEITAETIALCLPENGQSKAPFSGDSGSISEDVSHRVQTYFDQHLPELPPSGVYARIMEACEKPLIEIALEATQGNQAKCAELLGINRNTLRKKIQHLDVKVVRSRRVM